MEETLSVKADRLAREAVKREAAKHVAYSPQSHTDTGKVWYCKHDGEGWPCRVISEMSEAEEAINMAEEEEQRTADGPYHCNRLIYSATRTDPEEYCDEEVSAEGDLCPKHEQVERDESDRDDRAYDERKDARYDG